MMPNDRRSLVRRGIPVQPSLIPPTPCPKPQGYQSDQQSFSLDETFVPVLSALEKVSESVTKPMFVAML